MILVTGGNIGLGRECLHQLVKHNPERIYLAARSRSKAEATIKELNQTLAQDDKTQSLIKFLECDLSSFDSIKTAVTSFRAENERLDILMNNAGIMACPPALTKEGYEIQFGTNHVGHALLTKMLLPILTNTAQRGADVRIVNLSSAAERMAPRGGFDFASLKSPTANDKNTWTRYGQSKLANIHHARGLAKRHPELTVVSVHPGVINTNLTNGPIASYGGWLVEKPIKFLSWLVTKPVSQGALNQTWAATAPLAKNNNGVGVKTGTFYWPVGVEGKDTALARNDELTEKLWEWTEKELKGHEV